MRGDKKYISGKISESAETINTSCFIKIFSLNLTLETGNFYKFGVYSIHVVWLGW